ncbi:MAG: ATP phosphoribosyltransferase [Candidatus Hodarchaeales archaeon]|jgi:ATP phosphoribosyltransferase
MLQNNNGKIRFGIPSKGRMETETLDFFNECGFKINRNRRQYLADLEDFEDILMVFQRQEDIIRGLLAGTFTFGIVGYDLLVEISKNELDNLVIIHDSLGFGKCTLEVAIPEEWPIKWLKDLKKYDSLKIASKFPKLSQEFLDSNNINYSLVEAKGTIEVSPALGNSDMIIDLVSTGQTLVDNRLKRLNDGKILSSQAVFIANKYLLKDSETLEIGKTFLEYFEANIRGKNYVSVFVNIRGNSPEEIAEKLFKLPELKGLQGPTISQVVSQLVGKWYAIHIIVEKKRLTKAINSLRSIGGSGVVVTPALYIFEEEPLRYKELIKALEEEK